MNNNGWITDRPPFVTDATFDSDLFPYDEVSGAVWVCIEGVCKLADWKIVRAGQPWQRLKRPEPYVQPPKRYYDVSKVGNDWGVFRITFVGNHTIKAVAASGIGTREDAERIAAIYEEKAR